VTRVAAWASCGLVMAAGWVWLVASGLVVAVPEACAFHRATHLACPTCGMTRSLAALARGDLATSLGLHPLGIALVAELAALWLLWGLGLARGDAGRLERLIPRLVGANAATFALVWLARLLTGALAG